MIVTTEITGSKVTFTLKGRLDTQTVEILRGETQKISFESIDSCLLDLKDLEYVSSAGLREFITIRKKLKTNEQVILANVNNMVMDTLKSTGILGFFTIAKTPRSKESYIRLSYKDLLKEMANTAPDHIFLIGDEGYSWLEVEKCSQIIAMDLYKAGVRKGSHVAICGANSVNWVLSFFAVQKLGAIACLVNYNLSEKEIVQLSTIGDITHICCGEAVVSADYDTFKTNIINNNESMITEVYDIRSGINFKSRLNEYDLISANFDNTVEADDVAVMIFTSGSTGKPKGVLLSAYNVLNAAYAHMESIKQTSDDKACLILPLFHIFGLLSGLCTGMLANSKVIFPKDLRTGTILSVIKNQQCTIMHSVPTMMLAIVNNKEFSTQSVRSLRSTILAGAAVTESQLMMLKERFSCNHFSISYGLSEMAPITVTKYDDTTEHIAKTVGMPVKNIEIKIVNPETKEQCGLNQSGAIMVRGYNLMTCYYKLDLEDQAVDEEGWLDTGDLGFLDDEGYLHLSGRLKELIIRGGENIIPSEVASVISEFEGIADVKVVGIPDAFYGEIVTAAVLMKDGIQFDEEAMRSFLSNRIARFKLPAHFVVYDTFPTLSNGKIDGVNLKKDLINKCKEQVK